MQIDENLDRTPDKRENRKRWRNLYRSARKEARKELVGNLAELRKEGYSREALLESREPVAKQAPSKRKPKRKSKEKERRANAKKSVKKALKKTLKDKLAVSLKKHAQKRMALSKQALKEYNEEGKTGPLVGTRVRICEESAGRRNFSAEGEVTFHAPSTGKVVLLGCKDADRKAGPALGNFEALDK